MGAITVFMTLLSNDGYATATSSAPGERQNTSASSFALYALSRGKGVPERTRAVFQKARQMLEEAKQQGKVVQLVQTRIGLEGETRLCAEFADPNTARDMFEKIRQLAKDVELLNVIKESCANHQAARGNGAKNNKALIEVAAKETLTKLVMP
jgi:hypothetical protein